MSKILNQFIIEVNSKIVYTSQNLKNKNAKFSSKLPDQIRNKTYFFQD